ncbi:hypothetical protein WDK74_21965 [Escherichia coli]
MERKAFYSAAAATVIRYVYIDGQTCFDGITGEELTPEMIAGISSRYPDLQLINPDEADRLRDWSLCTPWQEITQERYDDMFNTLYPADWKGGPSSNYESFKFAEGVTNLVSYIYARKGGRYFECRGFREKTHEAIIDELKHID